MTLMIDTIPQMPLDGPSDECLKNSPSVLENHFASMCEDTVLAFTSLSARDRRVLLSHALFCVRNDSSTGSPNVYKSKFVTHLKLLDVETDPVSVIFLIKILNVLKKYGEVNLLLKCLLTLVKGIRLIDSSAKNFWTSF
ncbi:hypothetical protein RF11_05620 [Thelohanellus kitauei]|uniref:Uncharacterized protein n=1 Tax=Thelohanellus kitauei TaxID=669202 RepID=A0A0C2IVV4_THEKT|nr:hypothetical protein RF11_05620 [Thelohanellus kitauei]